MRRPDCSPGSDATTRRRSRWIACVAAAHRCPHRVRGSHPHPDADRCRAGARNATTRTGAAVAFPPMTITILDGGMGKELRRIGAPFRQPEWSALALIESPDQVEQRSEEHTSELQSLRRSSYA